MATSPQAGRDDAPALSVWRQFSRRGLAAFAPCFLPNEATRPLSQNPKPPAPIRRPLPGFDQRFCLTKKALSSVTRLPMGFEKPFCSTTKALCSIAKPLRSSSKPLRGSSKPFRSSSKPLCSTAKTFRSSSKPLCTAAKPLRSSSKPLCTTAKPLRSSSEPLWTTAKSFRGSANILHGFSRANLCFPDSSFQSCLETRWQRRRQFPSLTPPPVFT